MARFETWLHSDLKQMVNVADLNGVLFSKDSGGNLIGVEVTDDGAPAALSGTVMGYAVLSDGTTVKIGGSLDRSKAYVVLPSAVYAVPGSVSIVIKVGTTTVGACRGTICSFITDTIV